MKPTGYERFNEAELAHAEVVFRAEQRRANQELSAIKRERSRRKKEKAK